MRRVKRDNEGFVFQLSGREKEMLLSVLRLYPQMPAGHFKLSQGCKVESSTQALLDEALAEQKAENQRSVQKLLGEPARWVLADHFWRLKLNETEVEWLLQVLNDIRVGSWVLLGSPEEKIYTLSEETAPHFWAMEVAGGFQMELLAALAAH